MTPAVIPARFHPGHPAVASAVAWAETLTDSQARELLRDLEAPEWPGNPRGADTLRRLISGQNVQDIDMLVLHWFSFVVEMHKRGKEAA